MDGGRALYPRRPAEQWMASKLVTPGDTPAT
jgi:hypothetical protein